MSAFKTKILFLTTPHGEQVVSHILNDGDDSEPETLVGHSLVQIKGKQKRGKEAVTLTAEELDDLSRQWIAMRKL
jgi:hypothetical protein